MLIDHHTDMQDASLGGDILSCGNWAKKGIAGKSVSAKAGFDRAGEESA